MGTTTDVLNIRLNAQDNGASQTIRGVSSALGGMKGAVASLASGVTIGAILKESVTSAGDLQQNLGGASAVFKSYATSVQTSAASAYSALGLSQSDYLANANKIGALLKGSGFSIAQSTDLTTKAMQRAADVASIMGLKSQDAMTAIAGAAKGNFTMMDNLGVAINDTTLQIYAQEKGLGKLETTQQKVNAALQMFMEKTEYAAGNYVKENNTFAGSLQTLKANISNVAAEFGTGLLPLMQTGISLANSALQFINPALMAVSSILSTVGNTLNNLTEPQKELLKVSLTMVGAIGAITLGTKLLTVAKISLGKAIMFAKTQQLGLLSLLKIGLGTIAAVLAVTALLGAAQNKTAEGIGAVAETEVDAADSAEKASDNTDDYTKSLKEAEKAAKSLAGFDELTRLGESSSSDVALAIEADTSGIEDISESLNAAQSDVNALIGDMNVLSGMDFSKFKNFWDDVFQKIATGDWEGAFSSIAKGADELLTNLLGDSYTNIRDYWVDIKNIADEEGVLPAIGKVCSDIDDMLCNMIGQPWIEWSNFWQGIGAHIFEFINGDLAEGLTGIANDFSEAFQNIWNSWYNMWSKIGANLYETQNQGEVEAATLRNKYSGTIGEINDDVVANLKQGMSSEDALDLALADNLNTSELQYYYNNVLSADERISGAEVEQWRNNLINSGQMYGTGDTTEPLTATGVYDAMTAALENNEGFVGPIQINTTVELDGEKVGESVEQYQNQKTRIRNGY